MKRKIVNLLKFTGLDKEILEGVIEVPKDSNIGDYAFPCFLLAKKLKKNPVDIARDISSKTKKGKDFERIEASGAYVNFFVDRRKLAGETIDNIAKKGNKYGSGKSKKETIMIEFSQPNTHKAFHFGHVRGTSLGESIARIIEFSGRKVVRANYSGDTGMHIAKWLWCYQKYHYKEKIIDNEKWFADIYVDAVKRLEKNEDLQKEVDEINKKLDLRDDKELNNLWKETRRLSISSWDKIYHELNTKFDVHYFESEFEKTGKEIANSLVKNKIAEISEGATIVDFKKYNQNMGVIVLLRKDGTVLYGAKDIALAKKKFKDYSLKKSIYVIGREQDLHIHQVFEILKMMKFENSNDLEYIPVTEIRFPWGKMSSRSGDNVIYSDFKIQIVNYASKEVEKRYKELDEAEIFDRALAISIAAIKYSLLKQDVNKNIIFNPKEEIKFEGDTGPYLLYSYARALSILKKADYKKQKKFKITRIEDSEKKLIGEMGRLPEIVIESYNGLNPSVIAHYTYELARTFNEFYHSYQVIGSEQEQFRLKLVDSFSQTLKNSLWLLGINVIPKM